MPEMKRPPTRRKKQTRTRLDLSLLRINAGKTVSERIEAHNRSLNLALALREAVRKANRA